MTREPAAGFDRAGILDQLSTAVLVVDGEDRLVWLNVAAADLLSV